MGGSGSGGSPIPRSGGDADNCNLDFPANLFGPIPNVVATLSMGDYLDVVLDQSNTQTVVAANSQKTGQRAGTIAGTPKIAALVACLKKSHTYEAEVISIKGSAITLQIRQVS